MDLQNLKETKEHYAAFGTLPLETMTVLFELAEKQLADPTVEFTPVVGEKVVTKKGKKAD